MFFCFFVFFIYKHRAVISNQLLSAADYVIRMISKQCNSGQIKIIEKLLTRICQDVSCSVMNTCHSVNNCNFHEDG